MEQFLSEVISALAAGALAKAGKVGGKLVIDAYDALKSMIVNKLGKGGAVQSVEDEPDSEAAQATLAEALLKKTAGQEDADIAVLAKRLHEALADMPASNAGDIEAGAIKAKLSVLIESWVASGRIKMGDITSMEGGVTMRNLHAGGTHPKNA